MIGQKKGTKIIILFVIVFGIIFFFLLVFLSKEFCEYR